jgi:hypothetical protein
MSNKRDQISNSSNCGESEIVGMEIRFELLDIGYWILVIGYWKLREVRIYFLCKKICNTGSGEGGGVGKVNGELMVDLSYEEDSSAEVDMNIVMTGSGNFVEIQGTAEFSSFTREELDEILLLAKRGTKGLIKLEKEALGDLYDPKPLTGHKEQK